MELRPHDPLSEIQAFGVVPTLVGRELSFVPMAFHDVDEIASTETVFPGVPVGDVPNLGGTYRPWVGVHNFSNQTRIVTVLQAETTGEHSTFTEVDQVTVAPLSVMSFKIGALRDSADATNSFVIKTDGQPGDVQTQLWSEGEEGKTPIVFAAKDAKDERNGGIHPWTLQKRSSDSLFLFNLTDTDQVVHLKINNRVSLWTKAITLSPHETRSISLSKLAEDQMMDDMNTPFSTGLGEGEISWYTVDAGKVKGRLQHIDMQFHLVTSFQCQAYYTFCGIDGISGPSSVAMGDTATYSSGNAWTCVNNQGNFCSGALSSGAGVSWQWSGFSNFTLQGSSSQMYVSLKAATAGPDTLEVMATANACIFYQTTLVQVAPPQCFAQLKYRNAVGGLATHAFWYIQDSTGEQFIVDGGPSGDCVISCGYLVDYVAESTPPLLPVSGRYPADNTSAGTWWSSGPPASGVCTQVDRVLNFSIGWSPASIPYNPLGPNSNTFAQEAGASANWFPSAPPGAVGW